MTNNKQTEMNVAELAMKLYPFSNSERNAFITGYNKAKEMEKERIAKAFTDGKGQNFSFYDKTGEQYYQQTYGGGEL